MPISYTYESALELKAIKDKAIKAFVLEILKNGSFLKKKEHINAGRYKTALKVGVVIYFEQDGNDILVLGIK